MFLLIDIRHEPSENDQLMYEWMVNMGFAPIIIATKADKLSRGAVAAHVEQIKRVLDVEPGTIVIPFSAETKQGREEIWELIDSLVLVDEEGEPLSKEAIDELLGNKKKEQQQKAPVAESGKKPRWKAIGKETGKRKANENKKPPKHGKKSRKNKNK